MSRILVPPNVLLAVADQFDRASNHLEAAKDSLNNQISMLMLLWDGTTRQRFFENFQRTREEMKLTIGHMQVTSQELKNIAYRFMQVDGEHGELDPKCSVPVEIADAEQGTNKEKTWQEELDEFWGGVKSGGKILANSIGDTAKAVIEDPLGTTGKMAYNATIGTVEEVVDTTVWGTKMAFDVGDTREKFNERVEAEETRMNEMGMSGYIGQQAALVLGGAALHRAGVKKGRDLKPHADLDGGKKEKVEGTGNIQTGGREMSLKEYARQEAEASKMYDSIRASATDVQAISTNTGMAESRVQRIKDHVFNNEHIKSSGNGRFDPDYEIAQAWQRLQNGAHTPKDIELLNHEIFESKFEGIFKTDYEKAHSASEKSGRVWRP